MSSVDAIVTALHALRVSSIRADIVLPPSRRAPLNFSASSWLKYGSPRYEGSTTVSSLD